MVALENLYDYSLGLETGKYTGEQVVAFFRRCYGDNFSSHDLRRACSVLGWTIRRRSGKSDFIYVK